MRFTHVGRSQRVVFAPGGAADATVAAVEAAGGSRAMLIASEREEELADPIQAALVAAGVDVVLRHDEVVMHVPLAAARRARDAAAVSRADVVVSVGGGSTTGMAKAVVMTGSPVAGLPLVAVPTTYAGSEATDVWGLTDAGVKTTGVDPGVLPASVVYDATLLASLPGELAVASGLNALAHAIDAMWGPRVDPIDQVHAQEGIRALAAGLPSVAADPGSPTGIEDTLYGAYLSAVSFASAGSGLHHKICHVLGGMFDLPHAPTHAVVLPHVLALNAPSAPLAAARIARGFDTSTAVGGLAALHRLLDPPRALRDLGMPEDGIAAAVPAILAVVPAGNPTPVTPENVAVLLRAAWEGRDPR